MVISNDDDDNVQIIKCARKYTKYSRKEESNLIRIIRIIKWNFITIIIIIMEIKCINDDEGKFIQVELIENVM